MQEIRYEMGKYDVIVVGAGHAGCEAALASARLGKSTLILTISFESIAHMPCNPSIGGTGKGQLVKEIDALGGEMGINIDKTFIQSRMLNSAKGPAVHSPRAQADKQRYHEEMKFTLEKQEKLDLVQGEVIDLILEENPLRVAGVIMKSGACYMAKKVILATGTYLNSRVYVSGTSWPSGPSGLSPSLALAEKMNEKGLHLRRFKTGTPARLLSSSLDFSVMQEQPGDDVVEPFSFMNDQIGENKIPCWLTYTNERTHEIVAENITKTAPYGGYTTGVGPRYCLSIEDKVDRFPDRKRHQLFLEPEGMTTEEVYVQGMSTSLPENIQTLFYRSIEGLENAKISRFAYSIEYDCLDPLSLKKSLEHRKISGIYCAGQLNGSSGYEEAAAQGLIAGINAARALDGKNSWTPDRSEAYIGVLIDDLVTKGTSEPYRIMTSRAEFRLVLRQDNADLRLTEQGFELGLVTKERYDKFLTKKNELLEEMQRLKKTFFTYEIVSEVFPDVAFKPIAKFSLAELLRRPELDYEKLSLIDKERPDISRAACKQAEIQIKYEGYIEKQLKQIEKFKKLENKLIPEQIDYLSLHGFRLEAAQKLDQFKPSSIGEASRISGVSPADINVLLIHLARLEHEDREKMAP